MIPRCAIDALAERAGRCRRSATACGAWPAGPGRRRGVAGVARSRGRARLQLLRHRVGLRRRAQRAAARRAAEAASRTSGSTSRPRSRRRTASGRRGPSTRSTTCIPPDYIREYTEKSLDEPRRLDDRPAAVPRLERHVGRRRRAGSARSTQLKEEGLVRAIGISINRWQPANVLRALETGLIDACRSSTTSSIRPRGRAVPGLPSDATSR